MRAGILSWRSESLKLRCGLLKLWTSSEERLRHDRQTTDYFLLRPVCNTTARHSQLKGFFGWTVPFTDIIKLLVFYSSPDDLPRSGQVDAEAPVGLQTVSLFTFWGEVEENAPFAPSLSFLWSQPKSLLWPHLGYPPSTRRLWGNDRHAQNWWLCHCRWKHFDYVEAGVYIVAPVHI